MRSVRNARVPVQINYTGLPGSIGLGTEGLPDTVMIEVRDAGQRLNSYFQDPLRLTIDLRNYIHGEKGTIHIPADALRRSISDILQGTSRLIETRPEEIQCTYFTEQEKRVAIGNRCGISLADEYQMVGEPTLNMTTIKIYGQDKTLQSIDTIYTESTSFSGLSDTTNLRVALVIPKGVRAKYDSVDIRVITERFTAKKFMIPLRVKNAPDNYRIRLFPNEVEVSMHVGLSHFNQVHREDIHAYVTYTSERKDKLDVTIEYKNPYIREAWVYPAVVEFLLEQ